MYGLVRFGGYTGFTPGIGAVGTAVDREPPLTRGHLAVEPGNSPEQETRSRLLLLIE